MLREMLPSLISSAQSSPWHPLMLPGAPIPAAHPVPAWGRGEQQPPEASFDFAEIKTITQPVHWERC